MKEPEVGTVVGPWAIVFLLEACDKLCIGGNGHHRVCKCFGF